MTNITFVGDNDTVIGTGTKQEVWEKGIRHRIVGVYVLNSKGELLLAKRRLQLASLPGRWNESAAGHVDEGEEYQYAAERETKEELGISVPVKEISRFKSEETDEPDKKKNRFTAVYVAHYDGEVHPDEREVAETKWMYPKDVQDWINRTPDNFTEGFILGFKELVSRNVIKI